MNFADTHVNKSLRFSIGLETTTGRYYLSIPVANRLVDYEEYYEISRSLHDNYPETLDDLVAFATACRNHECDQYLIVQPGSDRGVAC